MELLGWSAVVFLAGMTSATNTQVWRHSVCIPLAENVIDWMMPMMPESIASLRK